MDLRLFLSLLTSKRAATRIIAARIMTMMTTIAVGIANAKIAACMRNSPIALLLCSQG